MGDLSAQWPAGWAVLRSVVIKTPRLCGSIRVLDVVSSGFKQKSVDFCFPLLFSYTVIALIYGQVFFKDVPSKR